MSVELFTIATRTTPGLVQFQASLSKFGVPITILGENETEYWGHGWRWKTFVRAVRSSPADIVIHCDAFDSLCLESLPAIEAKFASLGHSIVFAYEPQSQPEFWLALQPGLMIANRAAITSVFNEETLEALFPNHFNDQYQIQCMYSWAPDAFKLDREGVLFHTLGPRSPELVGNGNRLINPVSGKSPSFVHAPQGWDLSKVEQWLASV